MSFKCGQDSQVCLVKTNIYSKAINFCLKVIPYNHANPSHEYFEIIILMFLYKNKLRGQILMNEAK